MANTDPAEIFSNSQPPLLQEPKSDDPPASCTGGGGNMDQGQSPSQGMGAADRTDPSPSAAEQEGAGNPASKKTGTPQTVTEPEKEPETFSTSHDNMKCPETVILAEISIPGETGSVADKNQKNKLKKAQDDEVDQQIPEGINQKPDKDPDQEIKDVQNRNHTAPKGEAEQTAPKTGKPIEAESDQGLVNNEILNSDPDASADQKPESGTKAETQETVKETCTEEQKETCTEEQKETCEKEQKETCEKEQKKTCEKEQKETCTEEQKETCEKEQKETCEKKQKETCTEEQKETCEKVQKETCEKEQKETCEKEQKETCEKEQKETCEKEQKETCEKEQKLTCEKGQKDTCKFEQKDTCKVEQKDTCKTEQKDICKMEQKDTSKVEQKEICKMEQKDTCKMEQNIYKVEQKDTCKVEQKDTCKMEQKDTCKVETPTCGDNETQQQKMGLIIEDANQTYALNKKNEKKTDQASQTLTDVLQPHNPETEEYGNEGKNETGTEEKQPGSGTLKTPEKRISSILSPRKSSSFNDSIDLTSPSAIKGAVAAAKQLVRDKSTESPKKKNDADDREM